MFIEDKLYQTNLVDVNNVRYLLFTNFYSNMNYIQNLTEIISRYIECIGIDYSATTYTFTIKIKKTAMRRSHRGFKHNPDFYYQTIPSIFKEFIKNNEQTVLQILGATYDDPNSILQSIYNNPRIMNNLCHVTCISDNVIMIKL